MQNEKGINMSAVDDYEGMVVSSTDGKNVFAGVPQEVIRLLAEFAKDYEDKSFIQMRCLLADDFRGNFAGRKTADGLISVFRNYRLQIPFFMKVRMTIAIRKIMAEGEREFAGVIELNTRAKVFGRFFGYSFTTPPLLMTATAGKPGEWQFSGLDEEIDP